MMRLFGKKDWNYHDFNTKTKSFYDENGYDIRGYDKKGYDKKGYDLHGFDIKRIHKKTKTKFDEDGYDKKRYNKDGYAKDGFNRKGYDVDGYGRNGVHKVTGKRYIETLSIDEPPYETSENFRKKRRGDTDTQEYFSIWSQAVSLEYVTANGKLLKLGYILYLSLLHVTGKDSVYGAPKKKSDMYIPFNALRALSLFDYDDIEREYFLTSKGAVMLEVLARTFSFNSVPHIF
jgi:hypothetical protein